MTDKGGDGTIELRYDPSQPRSADGKFAAKLNAQGENSFRTNVFRSTDDPLEDALGSATESNPDDILKFKEELKNSGVELIERKSETLAYAPGLRKGEPGTVYVSEGASIGAWMHEMQHFRDDKKAGWLGMTVLADLDLRYEWEKNAYALEIELAKKIKRPDIAEKLEKNLKKERDFIYGDVDSRRPKDD